MIDERTRRAREEIVRAHVDAEMRGDWAAALATFHRPRYEIVATGEVHEGASAVSAFYAESERAFAELRFETRGLYVAESGEVLHEAVLGAVHAGAWRGLPATGRAIRYAMLNVFEFEGEQLVGERMYFDLMTPLRQIGIARDPTSLGGRIATVLNHPLVVARALLCISR